MSQSHRLLQIYISLYLYKVYARDELGKLKLDQVYIVLRLIIPVRPAGRPYSMQVDR